jgi:hypothetical protein
MHADNAQENDSDAKQIYEHVRRVLAKMTAFLQQTRLEGETAALSRERSDIDHDKDRL